MDAGLGVRISLDADGLAWALPAARVCLGSLSPDGKAPNVAVATIGFDALQPLQVHAQFASQIAFDNILAILDGIDDL